MHRQKKRAILTCYDARLDPVIEQYQGDVRSRQGMQEHADIFVRPVRPIGGIHFMTRGKCSNFLCGQIHGLIEIVGIDVVDLFLHTDCQFNRRAHRSRLERAENDMAFQIATLEKVHKGITEYIAKHFPERAIDLHTHIIHTEEARILTLEEAKEILPDHHHHHRRNKSHGHCEHGGRCIHQQVAA